VVPKSNVTEPLPASTGSTNTTQATTAITIPSFKIWFCILIFAGYLLRARPLFIKGHVKGWALSERLYAWLRDVLARLPTRKGQ
jgi:hypothetical protein